MKELKFPYSGDTVPINHITKKFLQTEELTADGVAVHPYGAIINPKSEETPEGNIVISDGENEYEISLASLLSSEVGDTLEAELVVDVAVVGSAIVGTSVVAPTPQ